MYPVRRATFPKGRTVEVSRYRMESCEGKTVELIREARLMKVDLAMFDARSLASALGVQREGWELRGLIVVKAVPCAHVLEQASAQGNARTFGAGLEDA